LPPPLLWEVPRKYTINKSCSYRERTFYISPGKLHTHAHTFILHKKHNDENSIKSIIHSIIHSSIYSTTPPIGNIEWLFFYSSKYNV
jgi:hypothetical protein